jgi:hypothetical protein
VNDSVNIQHKRTPYYIVDDSGFDDDGQRVPVVWNESDAPEPPEDQRADALKQFLIFATEGKFDVEKFGLKVAQVAFLAGVFPGMTQIELAEKLHVTPARVSQMLNALKRGSHR